jgi:hypothetical protein
MASLTDFLRELIEAGQVVLTGLPPPDAADEDAAAYLASVYDDYRRQIAGPPIPFAAATALAAAGIVRHACWFLLSRREPPEELTNHLRMPQPASSPAQHLSGDLLLRYLPQIHRRARALAADDPLPDMLADLLRRWPLSGVLADLPEGPLGDLSFGGHPGLLLAYAERLLQEPKPAWVPQGEPLQYAELVFRERGREDFLAAACRRQATIEDGTGEEDGSRE